MTMAEEVVAYAKTYLGVWYRYGSNSRLMGLDCSGFICDVLRMPGIVGIRDDYAAKDLLPFLLAQGGTHVVAPFPLGSILFFGLDGRPSHVGMSVSPLTMIESAGGDHTTTSYDAAAALNACVKISMISKRRNFICAVYPKYP